jgi:hypothetical protein
MKPLLGIEQPVHQEEMSDQQKRLVKKRPFLRETKGSAEAQLWIQLGPAVGALMPLSVNDRGHLVYPTTSSPRKDVPTSVRGRGVRERW